MVSTIKVTPAFLIIIAVVEKLDCLIEIDNPIDVEAYMTQADMLLATEINRQVL